MRKFSSGFTLIELMVVISIIAILSSVLYANFGAGRTQSRDAERKADLRNLQNAIDLYKNKYGRYPAGCNAASSWSGQKGSSYACTSGSDQYIVNLAPEFIPTLPIDPKLNGANSGYAYTTNVTGTVYKIMAKNTVESEIVDDTNDFRSCEVAISGSGAGLCEDTYPSNSKPGHCDESNSQYRKSYAKWGGYATGTTAVLIERYTEDITCDVQ